MLHGFAQGDAVSVLLLQPLGFEVANQGARAQEGGLVALAFFFREANYFNAKRQAFALAVQLAHTGHGHKNP